MPRSRESKVNIYRYEIYQNFHPDPEGILLLLEFVDLRCDLLKELLQASQISSVVQAYEQSHASLRE